MLINKINMGYYHIFLIFYQFLMKEWSTFCTFDPPFEIICSCYMSKVFSYFSKSTCLFKCWIETFFFSISRSTMGIRPLHFSSYP